MSDRSDARPAAVMAAGTRLVRLSPPGGMVGLVFLLIALIVLFTVAMPDRFPTVGTARSMMFQMPELGLLALAMVIPLIAGGINLAIIATANQCALLMAWILTSFLGPDSGGGQTALMIGLALTAGIALCVCIGLVTGWLVANMGVHPILVTLGTMSVINGTSIYLTRTAFGISVYMIGSNPDATLYSGIDTKRVLIGVYTLSSLLCFMAALLMMARFNSASAGYAQSYLLVTILAAVLGGIDPFGGFGRIGGLLLSLMILQVISSGFNLLGLSQHITLAFWGLTLIGVVAVKAGWHALRERRGLRRPRTAD